MLKFLFCVILFTAVSSFDEPSLRSFLPRCSLKDKECQLKQYEEAVVRIVEEGIPHLGIPSMDPMIVNNKTVSVAGLVNITLVDGIVEGMKDCKLESFDINMIRRVTKFDVFCDTFTVKGIYNLQSTPLLEQVLRSVVSGDGNTTVVMEKLKMHFINPFNVERHEDGEIYLIPDWEIVKFDYKIMEKMTFNADQVKLGILDFAPAVSSYINRNWKFMTSTFGGYFIDQAISLHYEQLNNFFNSIPAKNYITDDLSGYVITENTISE